MSPLTVATAVMRCPRCQRSTSPTPDSSDVLAWYHCEACDEHWSARLRNGRPDVSRPVGNTGVRVPVRLVHTFTGLTCPHCSDPIGQIVKADQTSIACECPNGFCWVMSPATVPSTDVNEAAAPADDSKTERRSG